MLKLNYAVASDRGLVRGNNEDSAFAGTNLLALADGMGGHAAGEIASQLMINHLMRLNADPSENDMLALLGSVADDANQAIADGVRDNPETDGMGTTLSALMFNGREFGLIHVGDSRGYRLRDGKLEQITRDDTYVQSLVDEGKLNAEDISTHPQRSLILKAYTGRPVEPTLEILDARPGDRILLCSDGLSDPVTLSTIETTLCEGTPAEAAARLVELALRSGGPDNVTVVLADVIDADNYSGPELPTTPVTAGALLGDVPEDPRPDTAAGRAAMMAVRQPETISPSGTATKQPFSNNQPVAPEAADVPPSKRGFLWTVIGLLLALVLLAGGGLWAKKALDDRFFITTDEDRIVVKQGADYSIFGRDLYRTHQLSCIDEQSNLKLVSPDQDDCSPFRVQDLKPDSRGSLDGLEGGNYDATLEQLQRLAKETLPVCVTREKPAEGAENPPGTESEAARSNEGDLNSPGVNCREVQK